MTQVSEAKSALATMIEGRLTGNHATGKFTAMMLVNNIEKLITAVLDERTEGERRFVPPAGK